MEENVQPSIASFALKQGLILGLISVIITLVMYLTGMHGSSAIQIGSAIITIAWLIYAMRLFKSEGDGYLNYGQAIGIGLLISVVSGLIGSVFVAVYTGYIDPSVIDAQMQETIMKLEQQGMSDEQIDAAMEMTKSFQSPGLMVVFGTIGSAFIGLILSLIIGAFVKNTKPEM